MAVGMQLGGRFLGAVAVLVGGSLPGISRAGDDFRIFWLPQGDDPTDYASGPTVISVLNSLGDEITFDIFIENVPVLSSALCSWFWKNRLTSFHGVTNSVWGLHKLYCTIRTF